MRGRVDWVRLAQLRKKKWGAAVETVMNILGSIEFWELLEWLNN